MTGASRPLPRLLWVPAFLAVGFFLLPWLGLLSRLPLEPFVELLTSRVVLEALWLSIRVSCAAAMLSFVFGLPLAAWLSAPGSARARGFVRLLVTLPMVLPPVVCGVALLLAYGRNGLFGSVLHGTFGFALPFTEAGVIVAATYVAMPFFVLTAESGLRSLDARYIDAAATLGARPWRRFHRVTLPLMAPALGAGLLVAWARALGEFGATITFAGNLAGRTRTMPLAVYVALETRPEAAIFLSVLLVLLSALVLFALRRRWVPVR